VFYRLLLTSFFFLLANGAAFSSAEDVKNKTLLLNECHDETLRIKFLCNPDWELLTKDNVILVVIDNDPYISLTIARSDVNVYGIEQLTKEMLKEMGQYRDGFTFEKIRIDQKSALKVDGISQVGGDRGLRDYYLIYKEHLYSILFTIQPNYYLLDYEGLIEQVIQSIRFE